MPSRDPPSAMRLLYRATITVTRANTLSWSSPRTLTLTPIAERLALELSLPILLDLGLSQRRMDFLVVYSSEMLTIKNAMPSFFLMLHIVSHQPCCSSN